LGYGAVVPEFAAVDQKSYCSRMVFCDQKDSDIRVHVMWFCIVMHRRPASK